MTFGDRWTEYERREADEMRMEKLRSTMPQETPVDRELRLLRELMTAVTRYVTPFNQGRPCISIDTLRQTVLRIQREIREGR